jgi:hypothetical protein
MIDRCTPRGVLGRFDMTTVAKAKGRRELNGIPRVLGPLDSYHIYRAPTNDLGLGLRLGSALGLRL